MDLNPEYVDTVVAMVISYLPNIALAFITLLVGLWAIRILVRVFDRALDQRRVDPSLKPFLESLVSIRLKVMLIISVVSMLGVEMTSFIAVLGAATFAIGLSLQGSLANFAGGVLILFFKPFKVGDFIETQDYIGKVIAIQVFNTVLLSPDNKTIILPNGPLSNSNITNFTAQKTRRVDLTFGISYEDDIAKAKKILEGVVAKETRILKDPEPRIAVSELADSSVNFIVWVWVNSSDYLDVKLDLTEKVKLAFDKEGVSIPYPQMDVHVKK